MTNKLVSGNTITLLQRVLLVVLFALGIGIRLYDLKDPPLDFHSARQLRSALIARAVFFNMDPSLDAEKRAAATNLANLEVYEPPILENLVGLTYRIIGSEQVWAARIYLALFWAVGGAALFGLGRRAGSFWAVIPGLLFYFFLPFGVIASRSFQPDPWMVMWILLTTWSAVRWMEEGSWKWALITGVLGAAALLVKVVSAFFVGGFLVPLVLSAYGIRRAWRNPKVITSAALMLIPTAGYYLLINSQRSSSFMSFWTGALSNLIWTTNFYADWLAMVKGLMGLGLFTAALLGALAARGRMKIVLLGLWAGYFIYGLVFPYQYSTHEYYHLPLVGLAAFSLIPICDAVFSRLGEQNWFWRAAAAALVATASFYSLWVGRSILAADDFRTEPISWRQVGDAIPADSKFIALTADYGMRLRYYGWRVMAENWPSSGDLNLFTLAGSPGMDPDTYFDEITQGMDLFLVTAFQELDAQAVLKEKLVDHFPVYSQGDGYVLYDLRVKGD